jgi:hypothetical protein
MNKEQILQLILTETEILHSLNVPRTYILYKNGNLTVTTPTYNINEDNERLFVVYKENGSIFIQEKF